MITKPFGVLPGVRVLYGSRFRGRHPHVNAIELEGSDTRALIDPGLCHEEYLAERGFDYDLALVTHSHPDHSSLLHRFACDRASHPLARPYLESVEALRDAQGLPTGELVRDWERLIGRLYAPVPARVTRTFEDGEVLDLGDLAFRVLHTPGHAPGHIALHEERRGLLLAGDYDLFGPGAFYSNAVADLDDWLASMERMIALAPRVIVTGHTPVLDEDVPARMRAYRDAVLAREEELLSFLRGGPRTLSEVHGLGLQRFAHAMSTRRPLARWYGTVTIGYHLERLIRHGRARLIGARFVAV